MTAPITITNAPLLALLAALLIVTGAREIILFTSFTTTTTDQTLAAVFAAALVAAKPILAAAAKQHASTNKTLAAICAALALPLILVSIAGTATYFESAYQTKNTAEQHNSTEHKKTDALIAAKRKTADQLKASAAKSTAAGNTWSAGQMLQQAAAIETELANITTAPATPASPATIAGSTLNNYRWAAWLTVALLADLLIIVAVLLLNENKQQNTEQTPEKQQQKQPAEQKTEQRDTWLNEYISKHRTMPTVRQAQAAGISYARYKAEADTLTKAGTLQPKANGRGWQLTNPNR